MGIISKIKEKYVSRQPLAGYKLGFCLHITKETAVLLMAAKDLGARITACSANPLSHKMMLPRFSLNKESQFMLGKDRTRRNLMNA